MNFLKLLLFIVLGIVFSSNSIFSQNNENADSLFYNHLYNFNFKSAELLLKTNKQKFESVEHKILSAQLWWWLLISEDTPYAEIDSCLKYLNKVTGSLSKTTHLNDNELFYAIFAFSHKARIELIDENYLAAIQQLKRSMSYLEISFAKEKSLLKFSLTSGLYNCCMAYFAEEYPLLYPAVMFYPKGNMKRGIELLETVAKSGDIYLSAEANYFLLRIFLEMKQMPAEANKYANKLIKNFPSNLNYQYFKLKVLVANKQNEDAKNQYLKIISLANKNLELNANQRKHYTELAKQELSNIIFP